LSARSIQNQAKKNRLQVLQAVLVLFSLGYESGFFDLSEGDIPFLNTGK